MNAMPTTGPGPVPPTAVACAQMAAMLLVFGAAMTVSAYARPYSTTQAQGNRVKNLAMLEGAVLPPRRLTADERVKAEAARNGFVGGRYVGAVAR